MGESKSARLRLLPHDIRGEFRDEQIEQISEAVQHKEDPDVENA